MRLQRSGSTTERGWLREAPVEEEDARTAVVAVAVVAVAVVGVAALAVVGVAEAVAVAVAGRVGARHAAPPQRVGFRHGAASSASVLAVFVVPAGLTLGMPCRRCGPP